ncbi:MAG: cytochrome c peroxidase [Pseudomonadota bacterium]
MRKWLTFWCADDALIMKLLLLALLALCASDLQAAESWTQESDRGGLMVHIEPVGQRVQIGEFQAWYLRLTDAQKTPIRGARILVGGGMRGHGHGLPTQPQVVEQMQAGTYLIEGLRFNMAGDWTLAFSIDSAQARDRVLFELSLSHQSQFDAQALIGMVIDQGWQPAPSVSNRFADDRNAARLGEQLFHDTNLSGNGEVSCATCHQPERFFTDGKRLGQGLGHAMRNTPGLIGVSEQSWFYWDGRRDSLWSQALVPFEAAEEMGSSRVAIVRHIARDPGYRAQYEAIFGDLPDFAIDTLPEHAGPIGDAASKDAWYRLPRATQGDVNAVFVNLGKSIEAFQRALPAPMSRFDKHVISQIVGDVGHGLAADHQSELAEVGLSESESAGLALFLDDEKTNCMRCHNGQWFTNQGFHNIGTGGFSGDRLDFGRVYGLQAAIRDEFNCLGPYSDAPREACKELIYLSSSAHVPLEGAFKVPTLRNLTQTAPYMHDGRFATLEAVVEHYRNPPTEGPPHELQPLALTDQEAGHLVAFLKSLSAPSLPAYPRNVSP